MKFARWFEQKCKVSLSSQSYILKYYSYVKQRLYKLVVPKRTAEVICTIVTYTQDVVPFCSVRKRVSLFSGLGITVFVIVTHICTIWLFKYPENFFRCES
jgi:hypothetical protein